MLTARQELLLKYIIKEFIETAQAVGSLTIGDKYSLDFSPATIRNEMARLTDLGLLDKSHSSAGRVPTSRALKWFLSEIAGEEEDLDAISTTKIKEDLFQKRFNVDNLMQQAVTSLTYLTSNTALAVLGTRRYIAGVSEFLNQPEYRDIDRLRKIIDILEDYNSFAELFLRQTYNGEVKVLIGEETGIDLFFESAIVFAQIKLHGESSGYIAVVGPNRMPYSRIIPAVKYIVRSVEGVVEGW